MADIRINALATTATTPASDDYLALDGTAQGTRKILATNIANNVTDVILGSSGPSVKSTLSARAPRQGLVFDGTAGATFGGVTFGSSDFTVSVWISVNSLSGNNVIIDSIGGGNNFALYVATDGSIRRLDRSTSTTASTAAGVISVGKTYLVTYVRGAFYVNGVLQNTFSDTSNYSTSMARIGWAASSDSFCTGFLVPLIYNRALSASEVVELYEAGAPAGADYGLIGQPASNTSIITGDSSTFTSGVGNWTGFNGGSISAVGGKGVIAMASYHQGAANNTNQMVAGRRYRLTVTVSALAGGSYVLLTDYNSVEYASLTAGVNVVEFISRSNTGIAFKQGNSGTTSASVDDISLLPLGLLLAPDAAQAGNGYVWNDQSGNLAQIVLPSSGVQWNLPSVAGQRIRGTTSTNGNQQLLGASVLLPAECQITHVRARARSGTPTITIGTASGGAQIVASVALSTTWLNCTIALTGGIVSSADDIWVGSNSTDVVETDIAFQPLDF